MPTQNNVQLRIDIQDNASAGLLRTIQQMQRLQRALTVTSASSQRLTDASGRVNRAFQSQRRLMNTLVDAANVYSRVLGVVQRDLSDTQGSIIRTQKEIDGMLFRLNRFNKRDRSFLQVEPPAERRPVGPGASRQAGNLFQPAPVGPSQQDIQRGLQLQVRALRDLEFLNERTAMGVANTWDGTFGEIGAGAQATGAALTAVTQAVQTQLQASRNLIAITNRDATDAATRQFRAIGDLSQLTFDSHEEAKKGLDLLISKQYGYLAAVNQTRTGFAQLSYGFANLANTGNKTIDGLLRGLASVSREASSISNLFGFGRNSGLSSGHPRRGFIQAVGAVRRE